jgi:hypothetical protein
MDDQDAPSPRVREGQSSPIDEDDLPLQDQPQAPNAADSQQRREVARLNPFDKAPPFLPDDYDDWALSFKLYCTPDMQNFLLTFDKPHLPSSSIGLRKLKVKEMRFLLIIGILSRKPFVHSLRHQSTSLTSSNI